MGLVETLPWSLRQTCLISAQMEVCELPCNSVAQSRIWTLTESLFPTWTIYQSGTFSPLSISHWRHISVADWPHAVHPTAPTSISSYDQPAVQILWRFFFSLPLKLHRAIRCPPDMHGRRNIKGNEGKKVGCFCAPGALSEEVKNGTEVDCGLKSFISGINRSG